MSEPILAWVARDSDQTLWLFGSKPTWQDGGWFIEKDAALALLPDDVFPDLRPGECRRMRLVDAPEETS